MTKKIELGRPIVLKEKGEGGATETLVRELEFPAIGDAEIGVFAEFPLGGTPTQGHYLEAIAKVTGLPRAAVNRMAPRDALACFAYIDQLFLGGDDGDEESQSSQPSPDGPPAS